MTDLNRIFVDSRCMDGWRLYLDWVGARSYTCDLEKALYMEHIRTCPECRAGIEALNEAAKNAEHPEF